MRMDPPGFEPGASALQGRRSPSLSYGPILRRQKCAKNTRKIGLVDDLVFDYYEISKKDHKLFNIL